MNLMLKQLFAEGERRFFFQYYYKILLLIQCSDCLHFYRHGHMVYHTCSDFMPNIKTQSVCMCAIRDAAAYVDF